MLSAWLQREREKLNGMNTGQKAEYIWQYYKLWLIGGVCLLWFLSFALYTALFVPKDNWLYVVFGNVPAGYSLGEGSPLHQGLAEFAGYDLSEKKLVLDGECYCFPSETPYSNRYYDKLLALLDGGAADAVVMEPQELLALARSGRLMDLQGEAYSLNPRWADRLIYLENTDSDYDKEQIPVAIDLTGSVLTTDGPYPQGCGLALSSSAPHPEELETLLEYLFPEETP